MADLRLAAEESQAVAEMLAAVPAGAARIEDLAQRGGVEVAGEFADGQVVVVGEEVKAGAGEGSVEQVGGGADHPEGPCRSTTADASPAV